MFNNPQFIFRRSTTPFTRAGSPGSAGIPPFAAVQNLATRRSHPRALAGRVKRRELGSRGEEEGGINADLHEMEETDRC